MSGEAGGAEAYLYVISCGLERAKIGVADDARKRLRELQVGSPDELKLALSQPYRERRDAVAVAEELYRSFAGRRLRGSWYRLALAQVREALSRPATLEAPARARAAAEAAARDHPIAPRPAARPRARTEKQRAYERRRRQARAAKQKRAAKLLAQEMTQHQAAAAVGVTSRTLRNWKTAPAFRRELERQHKHAARRQPGPAPARGAKAPARRESDDRRRDQPPTPPAQQQPTAEAEEKPPGGFRSADGVPLWGDSDGWPRTPKEHAERDDYYSARRDRSEADRYDDNTVARFGGQTAAEKRAVRQEQKRSRQLARAKRTTSRDP